ncbi:MAG TPA: ATP-grasp domain-containing protein [Allosphingosinicella sp.]|nr:ATP-grasp domain-containing protein [Allosphingosinicella sp.]
MKVRRVLVFPAGTEIGLEIGRSLRHCKEVALLGAGSPGSNPGRFAFAHYAEVPAVNEPGWLEAVERVCAAERIDYLYPANDDVILGLAGRETLGGARVVLPGREACEITRFKSRTYRRLRGMVRVPEVYEYDEALARLPVFVKPDRGQGSWGTALAHTPDELAHAAGALPDPLICEYLPGEEFTVDCFSDRDRGLLFAGARRRLRLKNGIAVHTRTVDLPEAREIAARIGEELGMRGAWFFQLRRAEDGELAVLEVAPRIPGSMSAHRVKGVNFPLLSLFEIERLPISILEQPYEVEVDRVLANRYRVGFDYDSVYLDFDDTLFVKGRINTIALQFVHQCIEAGKPVYLLTRHGRVIEETLAVHRIPTLFDKVFHLTAGERKSDYIASAKAIFIDDSFGERAEVAREKGIVVLDPAMIEALLADPYD